MESIEEKKFIPTFSKVVFNIWLLQLGSNVNCFSNTQKTCPYLFEILKLKKNLHIILEISQSINKYLK